jgi:hypothetical protein
VWAPEPVWTTWRRENSWPYRNSNSDPQVVQPDYAIPAPLTTTGGSSASLASVRGYSLRRPATGQSPNCQLQTRDSRLQSQSYFATGSLRPVSRLGVRLLETHDQRFFLQLNSCGNGPHVTSSLTRGWVCRLQLLLVLASLVILSSESRGAPDHILLSQIRESPNLKGQILVFISHRNRVAQLYTQALGSLFVAFYDSQGYGRGIRTRLHTFGFPRWYSWYSLGTDPTEITASHNWSVVARRH